MWICNDVLSRCSHLWRIFLRQDEWLQDRTNFQFVVVGKSGFRSEDTCCCWFCEFSYHLEISFYSTLIRELPGDDVLWPSLGANTPGMSKSALKCDPLLLTTLSPKTIAWLTSGQMELRTIWRVPRVRRFPRTTYQRNCNYNSGTNVPLVKFAITTDFASGVSK